jgi:hypothetical protein
MVKKTINPIYEVKEGDYCYIEDCKTYSQSNLFSLSRMDERKDLSCKLQECQLEKILMRALKKIHLLEFYSR